MKGKLLYVMYTYVYMHYPHIAGRMKLMEKEVMMMMIMMRNMLTRSHYWLILIG